MRVRGGGKSEVRGGGRSEYKGGGRSDNMEVGGICEEKWKE